MEEMKILPRIEKLSEGTRYKVFWRKVNDGDLEFEDGDSAEYLFGISSSFP